MAGKSGMKWSPYKRKKRKLIQGLQKVYTRLKSEAVFDADVENCQILKDSIEFFKSMDSQHDWLDKKYCPICIIIKV